MMAVEQSIEFNKCNHAGRVSWMVKHDDRTLVICPDKRKGGWEVIELIHNPKYGQIGRSFEKQFIEKQVSGGGLELREAKRLVSGILDPSTIEPKAHTIGQLICGWHGGRGERFAGIAKHKRVYVAPAYWFNLSEKEQAKIASLYAMASDDWKGFWGTIQSLLDDANSVIKSGNAIELELIGRCVDGSCFASEMVNRDRTVRVNIDCDYHEDIVSRFPQAICYLTDTDDRKPLVWYYGGKIVAGLMPLAKD